MSKGRGIPLRLISSRRSEIRGVPKPEPAFCASALIHNPGLALAQVRERGCARYPKGLLPI